MCGVSTGAVATAVSAYTPARGARTAYVAYQPVRAGGFRVVRNLRYRPWEARRSLTTGMFVRTADSPCTVTVTAVCAADRAVLPLVAVVWGADPAVPPLAAAVAAVIAPRPAAIAVRLLKSMPPADTHGPSLRVTCKSVRTRKRVRGAP
ncbi:hypothetical protein GCM10010234_63040 [Streptomyces hawaiiensis]